MENKWLMDLMLLISVIYFNLFPRFNFLGQSDLIQKFKCTMAPSLWYSCSRWSLNSLAKLASLYFGAIVHLNFWIKSDWPRKLNLGHQLIYVALINSIESIYHFFAIPRCIYASINYNGVTLNITDSRYSAESHMYCSAQPSVFSHILLNDVVNTFLFFRNEINCLLCDVVVTAYFLLFSDQKEWPTAWRWCNIVDDLISTFGAALKCSNAIPSIDTDIFPP